MGSGLLSCQTTKVEAPPTCGDGRVQSAHIQCFWSGEQSPLAQCLPTRESLPGCGLGARAVAAYQGLVVKNLLRDQDHPNGNWVGFEVHALPDGSWGQRWSTPDGGWTFVIDVPAPARPPSQ